jgi:hypothetical protein
MEQTLFAASKDWSQPTDLDAFWEAIKRICTMIKSFGAMGSLV